MHVLFVSTRSPWPLTGGHALRTFHLLREAARQHCVSFLTFVQHEEEWDGLPVLREFCEDVVALPIPGGGKLALAASLSANVLSSRPFVATKYDTQGMRRAIDRVKESRNIDLIHLDMLPLSVYAGSAGRAPVVQVDHNVEYILLERRAANQTGFSKRFWTMQAERLKRFESAAVRNATRTIAVSDLDAGILRQLAPGAEVRTVPNGVDTAFFHPLPGASNPDHLVFVGSMTYYPNVDSVHYFVDAIWPAIRAARPKAQFTVIGAHPPESIKAFGSAAGINVLGQVPDIRPYVGDAAVYVVPLRVGGGTRLKILDAMAMGKAIVSTTVGCEGLDVADGRDIAVADTPSEFAGRVLTLMNDAATRDLMGSAARATVQAAYGWERLGAMQESVYQEARDAIRRGERDDG
ncbi:MAG TPA: glycosyltransferase [Armatimonadota bacterium]|jgi:sugar transferase (PEP-CTERM/EpsH1 system associated)